MQPDEIKITRKWAGVFEHGPHKEAYLSWGKTTPPGNAIDPVPRAIGFYFTAEDKGKTAPVITENKAPLELHITIFQETRSGTGLLNTRLMNPQELQTSIARLVQAAVKHAGQPVTIYDDHSRVGLHYPAMEEILGEVETLLGVARGIFEKAGEKDLVDVVKKNELALKVNKRQIVDANATHNEAMHIAEEATALYNQKVKAFMDRFWEKQKEKAGERGEGGGLGYY